MNGTPEAMETLENFFNDAETGRLFDDHDPTALREYRNRVKEALTRLLVWERPELAHSRGIAWPYETLARLAPAFERRAGARAPRRSRPPFSSPCSPSPASGAGWTVPNRTPPPIPRSPVS